ncbi:BamA/TamA family outer membrane protein [Algoriphagus sp. CAU 1675]|uniref:BamA/TamA family outer membrane protein n=1 Tax=Algoriphagus sp. CAU 1675 TaxID=3032597 RepID=UPI0023DA59F0|nr:BamA/TamA family outer membrane protein [Algoriphagus sp. CAU 1675]MDF2158561.1 BamA/TamA family outer membrane protein [Algoriphagus sp. CAU 1675]
MKRILLLFLILGWSGMGSAFSQTSQAKFRLYLIGDAGEMEDMRHPVVDDLKKRLANDTVPTNHLIYLGDNIYPLGLPEKEAGNRMEAEEILRTQLDIFTSISGKTWMIPGNHDWEKGKSGGYEAILRAQNFVETNYPIDKVQWLPSSACPGPVVISLDEETLLILLDSQWWLQGNLKPGEDSDCEYKTEEEILASISDILNENQQKTIVFAMHHPMRAYGPHNGAYSWKDHLFPLTAKSKNLYLPLPVLGSIYPLYRTWFGDIQDIPHPRYQSMIQSLDKLFKKHPKIIQVSGHEHGLFYTKEENTHYIVSGAGAKDTYIKKNNPSEFSYSRQGYAFLDFFENGEVKLAFLDPLQEAPLYESLLISTPNPAKKVIASQIDSPQQAVTRPISLQYLKGKGHQLFFGKNYRETWAIPVSFRALDLGQEQGGLKITKRGGGMQTRSLRLENPQGKEFVLRSANKYPENALNPILRQTIAKEVVQDQISASHPYAALAVAGLAEAAGVPHTHPELVYLPESPSLGIYQEDFGGELFLFEERETTGNYDPEEAEVKSTDSMLASIAKDNDNRVLQHPVLRARLFDLWIGDWDRHDDQWRWIRIEGENGWEFSPMPRDRDQAFFLNEGFFPWIASRKWANPKFQGFDYELKNVNGFMFNGRYFDRSFLNELDKKDWEEELDHLIPRLSDEVIEDSFKSWPKEIREKDADEISDKLKHRKTWLREMSLEYYAFLSQKVDIPGSQKNEQFEITHLPDGSVRVSSQKINKSGDPEQYLYQRTFLPQETKEIRIYGLEGKDRFLIKGEGPGKIKIRIIPGQDPVTFIDEADLKRKAHWVFVPKSLKNEWKEGPSSKIKPAIHPHALHYDRKEFKYDKLMPLGSLEFNKDDGIFLGAGISWEKQGWKKVPYQVKQSLRGNYAFRTSAFNLSYQGHAVDVAGNWDLVWDADVKAPDYVFNYFGKGNETTYELGVKEDENFEDSPDEKDRLRYYRARFSWYELQAGLQKSLGETGFFQLSPFFQTFRFDPLDNENKFITSPESDLDQALLDRAKFYTGLSMEFDFDKRDNTKLPSRGFHYHQTIKKHWGLNQFSGDFTSLEADLALYWSFKYPSRIVWATRFGFGKNWGDYAFFQGQTLGGMDNLRGFRRYRFNGDAVAYNNTEFRLRLFNLNAYILPATVGLLGFHDLGRVWVQNEDSSKWHQSLGGGIWLAPLNQWVATFSIGFNEEETLPFLSLGYQF